MTHYGLIRISYSSADELLPGMKEKRARARTRLRLAHLPAAPSRRSELEDFVRREAEVLACAFWVALLF